MAEKPKKPVKRGGSKPRKSPPKVQTYRGNSPYRSVKSKRRSTGEGKTILGFKRRDVAILFIRLVIACFIIGGLAVMYFAQSLPDLRALETIKKQQGITIETEDGRVIANYGDVYGQYIPYEQLPRPLVQAVVATEDRRFFEHHGIDVWGIARAAFTNISRGHLVQGGSTVTQQVAKNVFLTPERSLSRKLQEVLLAFWLEGRFTKKEIMAIYLNRVYLGAGTFGVDAAAHRYFNKSARDLNLYESALMAGLLKAPSRYSPAANTERAKERVHQVLVNMVDAGYLKQSEVAPALASYSKSPAHEEVSGGDVRYFTDWILDDIPNFVGQVDEDLVVTTTMSTTLQNAAMDALQNTISMQGAGKNISQGALVAMTPDGAVKAMVGGLSYAQSQYNRAAQAKRQPGSSFKVFVYLAALESGMTPQSTVTDAPISMQVGNKTWSPENFESSKEPRGDIPMVEAIRNSLNTVSVRLTLGVGPAKVAQMAERLGVPNVPAYPSIALGAVEATLLDMTGAYAHLANRGNKVEPYGILKIRTVKGQELYKHEDKPAEPVLATGTVDMMNYMLLDVARRGTGAKAALPGRDVAGKTGTSQDYKDAWFIGYTSQLVAGVWVGNDDNKPMKKITGGTIPAPIFHDFMVRAMEGVPARSIPNSPGSSEGLLPWLFGGSGENAQPAPAPAPVSSGAIPEDAPFARQNAEGGAPAPAPAPTLTPTAAPVSATPAPMPAEAPPTPQHNDNDVLTPQFWNKLIKQVPVPDKKQVEYKYPGQR